MSSNTSNPIANPSNDMFFNNPFNMPNTIASLIDFDPFEKGVNIDTDALGNPIKEEQIMAYGIADYVEPVDNFRITSNTGYRKPPKTKTGYKLLSEILLVPDKV